MKSILSGIAGLIIVLAVMGGFVIFSTMPSGFFTSPKASMVHHYYTMHPIKLHGNHYDVSFSTYSNNGNAVTSSDSHFNKYYNMSANNVLNYKSNHYLNKIKNLNYYKYHETNSSERTHKLGNHRYNTRTISFTKK